MRKNLRLLFLTLLCAVFNVSMAEEFDLTTGYENAQDVTTVEGEFATLTFDKGTGSNAPKWYTTGSAVRMYFGNTLTISSSKEISKVVFTCASSNPITDGASVDVGSFDVETATWTGSANEFVLTNGASGQWRIQIVDITYADGTVSKKNPGLSVSDVSMKKGETKELSVTTKSTGAITFQSDDPDVAYVTVSGTTYTLHAVDGGNCTITVNQAETTEYNAGQTTFNVSVTVQGQYPIVEIPFTVNFKSEDGQFVFEDVVNNLGTDVWKRTSNYGWTATAYVSGTNHDAESWLLSPIIDLSNVSTATLTINDQVNKYFGDINTEITINVREAGSDTWTNLNVAHEKPTSTWGGWSTQTVNLAAYAGKEIQIGFHYIGTATSSGTYEVQSFSVTAVVKDDPELSFNMEGTSFTAYLNEENTFPVLTNPHNLTVTYTSSKEDVATIDETGAITLQDIEGSTEIKAAFKGNDAYEAGEAKYTLIVKERPVAGTDVYELVTSVADLADGDDIIIVNEDNDNAIANRVTNNNRPAESVALEDDGTIKPSSAIARITLGGEEDAWTFKVTTGDGQGYLCAPGGGNYLRVQETVDAKAQATIAIENGVATVVFNNPDENARNYLRYNPNTSNNNPLFSCYAENSSITGLVRIYKMAGDKAPAGLAYSADEFTYTIGETDISELPTLDNPNNLSVTYTSSDEGVATINANGDVTIVAAGETVIKATTTGDATHKAGEASYTLTVEQPFVKVTYELVNNAKTLKAGDKIILVNAEKTSAMSTNQAKNNRTGAAVTANEDGTITPGADIEVITLGGEAGAWTLAVSGGYLYAPGGGNYLRTQAEAAEATIDINGEAGAEIEFVTEAEQRFLHFNPNASNNNPLFSCYKETSELPWARIYREVRDYEEVEITSVGYATMYYGNKSLKVPTGVVAKTYKAGTNGLAESKTYNAGSVIPAGTAVVLEGQEGMYTFEKGTGGTVDANNMLLGFDEPSETVGPDENGEYLFYILSTNKEETEVGFYFKEKGGAAFTCEAHKAYLAVPADMAAGFYNFDGTTDGINHVAAQDTDSNDVYTLSGVRVSGKLQKGIYIVNGKKVVIK